MEHFSVHGKKGIDDLLSTYPYSMSDWHRSYTGAFGVTEEEFLADPQAYADRVTEANEAYIKRLKETGEFEAVYTTNFSFTSIKEFDDFKDKRPPDYSKSGLLIPRGELNNPEDAPKLNVKWNNGIDKNDEHTI